MVTKELGGKKKIESGSRKGKRRRRRGEVCEEGAPARWEHMHACNFLGDTCELCVTPCTCYAF